MKQEINLTENQGVMMLCLTLGCQSRCAHCYLECGTEKLHLRLTPDEIRLAIGTAKRQNIVAIELAGGEPFLAFDLVELALKEANRAGLYSIIDTSASWAKTPDVARDVLAHLAELGLQHIRVSYDRYHAEFIPASYIINACDQAARVGCKCQILVTEANDDVKQRNIEALKSIKPFIFDKYYALHNMLPPAPIGRAANLNDAELTFNGITPFHCAHFKNHLPLVSVFPGGIVSFGCEFANPRLTYKYTLKEDWLSDMLGLWVNDTAIDAMWNHSLAELDGHRQSINSMPCGYCFELLPELYPDKELIDIRALLGR